MTAPSRRLVVKALGASALASAAPRLALASAPTDRRLVIFVLRGGLDGLAAVPALGDPNYERQRGGLAIRTDGENAALPLDGFFGLHPALETLHGFWRAGELLPLHAVASPYRKRSHFDAQKVLENGAGAGQSRADGWLNRALEGLGAAQAGYAFAFSEAMPLLLTGSVPVTSYAPQVLPRADDDFFARVEMLYEPDRLLSDALARGLVTRAMADDAMGDAPKRGGNAIVQLAGPAGRFLAQPEGARIAVLDPGGWDTHARQGAGKGPLANKLRQLDQGIATLKTQLGATWAQTAVVVVTEFGRTVAVNGTGGTDHGTAGAAFLFGGSVRGGRVWADWPGLAPGALHEGRDLRPTRDIRALFKAVMVEHLGITRGFVDAKVFPGSGAIRPAEGLFQA